MNNKEEGQHSEKLALIPSSHFTPYSHMLYCVTAVRVRYETSCDGQADGWNNFNLLHWIKKTIFFLFFYTNKDSFCSSYSLFDFFFIIIIIQFVII